jgi:DNA (cytosine-5)-methyltransferase 1
MLRAIREIKPVWIVGENVPGIISWNRGMVFNEVQTDLEAEGYEVQPVLLPACSVNAPHKRERVWFVAYSGSKRCNDRSDNREKRHIQTNFEVTQEDKSERNGRIGRIIEISSIAPNPKSQGYKRAITERTASERGRIMQSVGFDRFPTQSPICSGNDGISYRLDGITFPKWRNESIKALGNAIVPQVAYEIFKVIYLLEQK